MLNGVHPLLTGRLLNHLDSMGHSDGVVVSDANFPAERLAVRLVDLPGTEVSEVVRAIRTVLPLDEESAVSLMATASGGRLPIYDEMLSAASVESEEVELVERADFYRMANEAYLIVRTGERRAYGNILLRKGVVTMTSTYGRPANDL